MNFTHLCTHSFYTLLGATASPEALTQRAAADGLTQLALTDSHALYGIVAFARACRAAEIQPIPGMTVTISWPAGLPPLPDLTTPGELVLLATGPEGYRSLCRLTTLIQGNPDREERMARGLSLDELTAHRAGLICLEGGRHGWVYRSLQAELPDAARRFAGRLAGIFDDQTCLGLELHAPSDHEIGRQVESIGAFLGLPTVALQPVYCLESEETPQLRLMSAIARNCRLDELPPEVEESHWLSPAAMQERFAEFPAALARAGEIAAQCHPALPAGPTLWPAIQLPPDQTADQALAERARRGLEQRYGPAPDPAIPARLDRELAAIARLGAAPLFWVVADIVRFAHQEDIPVSTRGSVANSLVAYCVEITTVDPIAHQLLFERFLSPARAGIPDIDLDFCSRRRDEVLDYVRRTYGADHMAIIGTVNTFRMRSAARAVAKAWGLTDKELETLLAQLPHEGYGPRRPEPPNRTALLAAVTDPLLQKAAAAACDLVGRPDHLSLHPGGVVITPGPLTDILPAQWAPKGFLCTQFDHNDVEALGLPKIDLLGVRALTVLADAAELIRRDSDPDFHLSEIPPADPLAAALLERGDTIGVFQCESEGARRTLCQLRARTVADLAVANAFFKPGPAMGGQADIFIKRYRGEAPVGYLHPALAPILASTQGVLLFQEQILRVAVEIAGLSWAQADSLRRGMSRMDGTEMAQMQAEFEAGCQRPPPAGPGFTPPLARRLWEQIVVFSGYGFNQGHALAYADVSYRSAYLKAHWPAAFFCARLRDWGGYHHPAVYMAEAIRLGVAVRLPHINHSQSNITLEWENNRPVLRLGLGWIRDLRRNSVAALIAERRRGPFTDLRNLLSRTSLQARELDHLIRGGALDGLDENRTALLTEAERIHRSGNIRQLSFDFAMLSIPPETVRERWQWERRIVGYPLDALPIWLAELNAKLPGITPLSQLAETGGTQVTVLGVRLPGWAGRRGRWYIWDGRTWEAVYGVKPAPTWEPVRLIGKQIREPWGMTHFQATEITLI